MIVIIQIIPVITIADYSNNTIICLTLGLADNYCSFSRGNKQSDTLKRVEEDVKYSVFWLNQK